MMTDEEAKEILLSCCGKGERFSTKKLAVWSKTNDLSALTKYIKDFRGPTAAYVLKALKNNMYEAPVCGLENCNNIVKINASKNKNKSENGFFTYCSKQCASKSPIRNERMLLTKTILYGGNGFASEAHRDAACSTMIERYGVPYYVDSPDFEEKRKATLQANFGVDYPMQSPEIREIHKEVMLGNHGVENSLCADSPFREAALDYIKETYGNRQIMATQYIRDIYEERGIWLSLESKDDFALYRYYVTRYTRAATKNLENTDLIGVAGLPNAHHRDHKMSVLHGFLNNIPPFITGSVFNLEIIPAIDNCSKGSNSSITPKELCDVFFENQRQNEKTPIVSDLVETINDYIREWRLPKHR